MSLKTWKKEFYPVSFKSPNTKLRAIKHSLKKWRGLTAENLKKHNVENSLMFPVIRDAKEDFVINSGSCALCNLYFLPLYGTHRKECFECPLYSTLKKRKCDSWKQSPYRVWVDSKDPTPMIYALEKTLQNEIKTSR